MTSRRRFLQLGALGAVGISGGVAGASDRPWNIVVIGSDEHNPRFFGHLGHEAITPNMDRLASEGVRLDRLYTSSPVCAPTRGSVLTGLWPQEHSQINNGAVLNSGHTLLSSFFGDQGYDTACFGKLHTNGDEANDPYGFGELFNINSTTWNAVKSGYWDNSAGSAYHDTADLAAFTGSSASSMLGRAQPREGMNRDYVLAKEAINWISQARTKPFFCYLSALAPHYPFTMPEDFYYLFDPNKVTLPSGLDETSLRAASMGGARSYDDHAWSTMSADLSRRCYARYLGMVAWMDHVVGMVLDALDLYGLADDTIVLYVSDHGDMAGEHGMWLKSVMFDGSCRKAAILRVPGVLRPAQVVSTPMNEVDVLPTLAGFAGLGSALPSDVISGRSRAEAITRAASGFSDLVIEREGVDVADHAYSHWLFSGTKPWMSLVATSSFKYVRYYRSATDDVLDVELYDTDADPWETTCLADDVDYAGVLAELDWELEAQLAAMKDPLYAVDKNQITSYPSERAELL